MSKDGSGLIDFKSARRNYAAGLLVVLRMILTYVLIYGIRRMRYSGLVLLRILRAVRTLGLAGVA